MTTYAPAQPHGPIQALTERLYVVRGAMRMNPVLRISRNMVIIRHGDDLTLVNPIRLNAHGENALRDLGVVKRILRLGAFHGIDDPWYKHRFEGVELWGQPGGAAYPEPPVDHSLEAGTALPFPDADLFCFNGTTQPEAALLIHDSPGILVTCDAVQHYGDYTHNNFMARLAMPFIGFPKTTVLGPFWLKMMTPAGGSLRGEFHRLLELEFDALIAAHGTYLPAGAKTGVRRAVGKAFGGPAGHPDDASAS